MATWILRASSLLAGLLLITGCGRQSMAPERPDLFAPLPRTEARLHLPAAPRTLDSARASDQASFDLLGCLMEGLVRRGADGEIRPGVAARWETEDGREYTFYLRPDARWSDGSRVTAGDFVHAWLRALDPATGSDYAFLLYDIEGAEAWNTLDPEDPDFPARRAALRQQVQVEAVDPETLRVTLREPNPRWVGYTAHPVFYPQPAARVEEARELYGALSPLFISNGPFMLQEVTPDGEILLLRNLAYWDADSVRLERVRFRVEPDGQEALRLFRMGLLDHVALPGDLAAGEPGSDSMAQPSTMGLVFNLGKPQFANLHLRQAFHLALDRRRLVEEVAPRSAVPSAGLVPPSLGGGWEPAAPIPERGDRTQARQLWAAARKELGVDGMAVRLLHTEEAAALARAVQAMLQETLDGLVVEREVVSFADRLRRTRMGEFDIALQGWVADHDDPLNLLELFVADSPGNDARWVNPEYDELIMRARIGGADAPVLLAEAERMLLEQAPVLPLYHPVRYWLTGPALKGMRQTPLGARIDLRDALLVE